MALGSAAGALLGLLYVWGFDFSLRGFGAALAGGSTVGAVLGGYAALVERRSAFGSGAVAIGAGALGGAAWWAIAAPSTGLPLAAGIGGGIMVLLLIAIKLGLDA